MRASLNQAILMKLVEHPHKGDRLDTEPSRELSLADTLISRDVEHDRRLLACDQQAHLPGPVLKAPLDQSGNVMDEKSERAADTRSR
jgi:hypothetical protein